MALLENVAGWCIISVVGGSVFYFTKGTMRSSSGSRRLAGGVRRGAAWFALLTAMEATLHACHVQGLLNKALAWGATNAIFTVHVHRRSPSAVRLGLKAAAYGGAVGIAVFSLNAFVKYILIK